MRFISLSKILVRKEYLPKINNLPSRHGAGPPEVRGPILPHWLHRIKAGAAEVIAVLHNNNHDGVMHASVLYASVSPK